MSVLTSKLSAHNAGGSRVRGTLIKVLPLLVLYHISLPALADITNVSGYGGISASAGTYVTPGGSGGTNPPQSTSLSGSSSFNNIVGSENFAVGGAGDWAAAKASASANYVYDSGQATIKGLGLTTVSASSMSSVGRNSSIPR